MKKEKPGADEDRRLLDLVLTLFEQQASVNPNMPLRDLIYVAHQFEKFIVNKSVYSSKLVKLPEPRFVVFYNGTTKQPEKQVLKLSDAFQTRTGEPQLELKVTMYNINAGYNEDLMYQFRQVRAFTARTVRK